MWTHIGGHPGMKVFRTDNGRIRKVAEVPADKHGMYPNFTPQEIYEINIEAVANEGRMLRLMAGSGFAPALLHQEHWGNWIEEEDLGETTPIRDAELWRQNCVRLLAAIRARNIRHGDLTGSNMIIREHDRPYAIDWHEAHMIGEPPPQKSPYSDSYLLWRAVMNTVGPTGVADTPRVARRWLAVLGALGADKQFTLPLRGKTFLDLGCFQGDFVAMAATEGMYAIGVDQGGFRTGEDSIQNAERMWKDLPFGTMSFWKKDILRVESYACDVVLLFSTWPYIVKNFGVPPAMQLISDIVGACGSFFFETQLYGDGPGPEFLKTDSDVEAMLRRFGHVTNVATFPVTGRPASRTVWKVEARQ